MRNLLGEVFSWLGARLSETAEKIRPDLDPPSEPAPPQLAAPVPTPDAPITVQNGALTTDQVIYAIGDIHGRADLLEDLITRIENDCAGYPGEVVIIFLGDYVDRGFQSRQVIDLVLSSRLDRFTTYFLKGNHEEAVLNFLSDHTFGPKWSAYGGRETLVSYGIQPPRRVTQMSEWERAKEAFSEAMPDAHEMFFRSLLPSVRIGDYGFVHAGLKPGVPFDQQREEDLLWIRDEFLNDSRPLDVKVVHGHTPVEKPFFDQRRINVDTGAYFSGRLTAVRLLQDEVSFLTTET